jgi:hypothetical protein
MRRCEWHLRWWSDQTARLIVSPVGDAHAVPFSTQRAAATLVKDFTTEKAENHEAPRSRAT